MFRKKHEIGKEEEAAVVVVDAIERPLEPEV